jgi:hypothetical protein
MNSAPPLQDLHDRQHGVTPQHFARHDPSSSSQNDEPFSYWNMGRFGRNTTTSSISPMGVDAVESASRPLVSFDVLNDNLIKCLISFVKVYEQILSNRYKGIHGYITRSTILMKMELCDQCV